ncbi:hypothetical protein [Hornefia butyriciproducens]|nr:hypothetical protein [Hornefia butyriciproducens]MDY5423794.1 hypothetical protein [Hornefia butyriciproducens]
MRRSDCVRQKSANGFAPAGDSKGMRRRLPNHRNEKGEGSGVAKLY